MIDSLLKNFNEPSFALLKAIANKPMQVSYISFKQEVGFYAAVVSGFSLKSLIRDLEGLTGDELENFITTISLIVGEFLYEYITIGMDVILATCSNPSKNNYNHFSQSSTNELTKTILRKYIEERIKTKSTDFDKLTFTLIAETDSEQNYGKDVTGFVFKASVINPDNPNKETRKLISCELRYRCN